MVCYAAHTARLRLAVVMKIIFVHSRINRFEYISFETNYPWPRYNVIQTKRRYTMYSMLPGINYEADLSLSCVECNTDILPSTNYDLQFTKYRKGTSQRHIRNSHDVAQDYFILTGLIWRKMSFWKIEKGYVSELYLSARKQKH